MRWMRRSLRTSIVRSRDVRFMDHYSGGNATRIGVFSLFYSIPGTYWHHILAERQGPVFVTQLLKQGYDVQAFRSAPLFSPEFDRTVFAQVGTPCACDPTAVTRLERDRGPHARFPIVPGNARSADAVLCAAVLRLAAQDGFPRDYPLPFRPSAADVNYLRLDNETDPTPLLNRYRNSVHYVDALIGRVLVAMEQQGLLENSVVVVTGDHRPGVQRQPTQLLGSRQQLHQVSDRRAADPLLADGAAWRAPASNHAFRHRTDAAAGSCGVRRAVQDLQRWAIVVRSRWARHRCLERVHGLRHSHRGQDRRRTQAGHAGSRYRLFRAERRQACS